MIRAIKGFKDFLNLRNHGNALIPQIKNDLGIF